MDWMSVVKIYLKTCCFYFAVGGVQSIVMSLSVHLRNSKSTRLNFTKFCGRGSVLLRWRCDMLCTSVLWMTLCFYTMGPVLSMTLCLEEVCQVVVPVGCQTATVFGRLHQSVTPGAKSAIYD